MNEGISRYTSRLFSKAGRNGVSAKEDYKTKLWRTSEHKDSEIQIAELPDCPYADQIRHAAAHAKSGVAFQSLAVAALQTLRTVQSRERKAAEAAISLAQGEKLEDMIQILESTANALAEVLDAQGSHMLNLTPEEEAADEEENSWWFALTESIQSIEDGTNRILSLSAGQPKGGAGRRLSAVMVRLLRRQHQQLLAEADAWIS